MKIKQAEKTILKSIDPGYKSIARDVNGDLTVFEIKPTKCVSKGYWDGERYCQINVFSKLFEWIKWEDKEPFLIKEVIKDGKY